MSLVTLNTFRRAVYVVRHSLRRCSQMPDKDKPVKFTTSDAANWRAEFTRTGTNIYDDTPNMQPFIVSISTGVFLYYFLLYREESDIDADFDILGKNIYDKVDGLEEVQLRSVKEKRLNNNQDVSDIEIRLKELENLRLTKVASSVT